MLHRAVVTLVSLVPPGDAHSTARRYLGSMMRGSPVLRSGHKNAETAFPTHLEHMTHYPWYASGCFTVVSSDLARLLAHPPVAPIKMLNGLCCPPPSPTQTQTHSVSFFFVIATSLD